MWSCRGNMPKLLPRTERQITLLVQDPINIIIILSV